MPQMSSIISGAASLGVLAGVVSGLFYLVLSGIRWAGRIRAALEVEEARQDKCVSCGRRLGGPAPNPAPVVCTKCGRTSCFGAPCSRPAAIGWNCIVCHVKREMESSSGSWTDVKSEDDHITKSNGKAPQNADSETFQVREFIEKLVEKIVGGPLDGVTVGKLSSHPSYNGMFAKYHEPLCQALARLGYALHFSMSSNESSNANDTPNSAHMALSNLIEKVVLDAETLPNLTKTQNGPIANGVNSGTNGKSYEDILSTAVLNKIIEKFQRRNGYLFEFVEKRDFATTSSNSCIDDDNQSGSDWSEHSRSERSEPLALKVEEHIEEVTTAYESSGDERVGYDEEEEEEVEAVLNNNRRVPFPEFGVDIVDGNEPQGSSDAESDSCATDVLSTQSNWEENWLFQRKKLKSSRNSHHPVPVPMLVPNPSQEFRALIGGVDADDISDLSECSDSVLEEAMSETPDDSRHVLEMIDVLNQEPMVPEKLNVPHSIDDLTESVSRSEELGTCSSEVPVDAETCDESSSADTQVITSDSLEADKADISLSPSPSPSLVQQDRDVPVDYDQIATINAPPIPKPRTLEISTKSDEEPITEAPTCSIAEREKAKWNNAIEMKDNPYTEESIGKRTKNKSTFFSRSNAINKSIDFPIEVDVDTQPHRKYSRDYYIKSAKSPTGDHLSRSTDSPVSLQSEASLEVSRILNDAPHSRFYEDELLPGTTSSNSFNTLRKLTKNNLHFSKVFETKSPEKRGTPTYGHHSLRLPSKYKRIGIVSRDNHPSAFKRYESELRNLEQESLFRDLRHSTFRARNASPNFVLNPVFEYKPAQVLEKKYSSMEAVSEVPLCSTPDYDVVDNVYRRKSRKTSLKRRGRESGYGSSESCDSWRLTLPRTPEMTEVFKPLNSLQRPRSSLGLSSSRSKSNQDTFFL